MNRHLSRTIAMQSLYEWDFRNLTGSASWRSVIERNIGSYGVEVDRPYIDRILGGVIKDCEEIDRLLAKAAPEWPVEQIAPLDKAILRVAVFEIIHSDDVPPKVAINEAVELAKTFGSQNSSKFINGVLGTIYRQSARYDPKDDEKTTGPEASESDRDQEEIKAIPEVDDAAN